MVPGNLLYYQTSNYSLQVYTWQLEKNREDLNNVQKLIKVLPSNSYLPFMGGAGIPGLRSQGRARYSVTAGAG